MQDAAAVDACQAVRDASEAISRMVGGPRMAEAACRPCAILRNGLTGRMARTFRSDKADVPQGLP
jgi:hypothetical protein